MFCEDQNPSAEVCRDSSKPRANAARGQIRQSAAATASQMRAIAGHVTKRDSFSAPAEYLAKPDLSAYPNTLNDRSARAGGPRKGLGKLTDNGAAGKTRP
jgi:hypothetical protein